MWISVRFHPMSKRLADRANTSSVSSYETLDPAFPWPKPRPIPTNLGAAPRNRRGLWLVLGSCQRNQSATDTLNPVWVQEANKPPPTASETRHRRSVSNNVSAEETGSQRSAPSHQCRLTDGFIQPRRRRRRRGSVKRDGWRSASRTFHQALVSKLGLVDSLKEKINKFEKKEKKKIGRKAGKSWTPRSSS